MIQIAFFRYIEESGPAFLIQRWWPPTGSTVIAGTRASKKSYLALMLALSVTKGEAMIHTPKPGWAKVNKQARVAFLDWEAEIERIVPRVRALVPGGSLLYARERRPLAQSVDSIIDMIREEGIEAVVIDSLSASIGATLVDDEAANQFWDAVAALAVPVLVVAHKSADASSRREIGRAHV